MIVELVLPLMILLTIVVCMIGFLVAQYVKGIKAFVYAGLCFGLLFVAWYGFYLGLVEGGIQVW